MSALQSEKFSLAAVWRDFLKSVFSCHLTRDRSRTFSAPGNPSLEKCRALKEQREEAAEVASLDITNIISSSGEGLPPTPQEQMWLELLGN